MIAATHRRALASARPQKSQRGVVLFVALIVLVAMTLAGLAVVRTTDTGMLIAGNLAFRKNAKMSADFGIEMARQWLLDTAADDPSSLYNDIGSRYKATWLLDADKNKDMKYRADPHLWDWSDTGSVLASNQEDSSGNSVRYVIHRMCASVGAADEGTCVTSYVNNDSKESCGYGPGCGGGGGVQAYYRVTARVEGPRNTVTFVQTFLN